MTKKLIEEALRWANGHPNRRSSELMRALADALEAAGAERDAALSRIAELEQSLGIEALARRVNGTLLHEYERRFAEAAKLHRESINSASALYPTTLCECGVEYPCPTRIALGLDEGENDE